MISKNEKIYDQYMYSYPHKTAYRKVEKKDLEDYKNILEGKKIGLYAHIPFCNSKCGFCNLFSIAGDNRSLAEEYIKAMEDHGREIKSKIDIELDNFIVGGGTPLYLNKSQLERLFNIPKNIFNQDLEKIYTVIETSPRETSRKKLDILKKNHVNRVSIGVQSFLDEELKSLRRNHDRDSIYKALDLIKEYDFDILNIDIIYGIENQTLESLEYSLKEAVAYEPEEIFIYPLYIRENKTIGGREKDMIKMYNFSRDYLIKNGYKQESMRRFSTSKKQVLTCGFEESLSIGVGGRSYIGNFHTCAPYSDKGSIVKERIVNYLEDKEKTKFTFGYLLSEDEMKRRFIIKNLFVVDGFNIRDYEARFNSNILKDFPILTYWIEKNYLTYSNNRLVLTDLGLSLSDMLGPRLISREVEEKMKSWEDK